MNANRNILIELDRGICRRHTGKMYGMQSISTPCTLNSYCQKMHGKAGTVCSKCYAHAQLARYTNNMAKLENNANILTTIGLEPGDIPYINARYFRFEAFGELINELQVKNYFAICNKNQSVHFALWSKRPELIEKAMKKYNIKKPENLNIILSTVKLNARPTGSAGYDFIDKIFTVYDKKHAEENNIKINCGSKKCMDCLKCYTKSKTRYINELLK